VDIVGSVKEIADLAKKYNDIEFYRKIVELESEIIELTRGKREAEQRIEELQGQLALKAKMTFKQPFYIQEGDKVPFCPRCFEKEAMRYTFSCKSEPPTKLGGTALPVSKCT